MQSTGYMEGKPMKILMTADTIGGVWNYALDLSQKLAEYGVEIHLATMGRLLDSEQLKRVKKIQNVELYESDYKLEWMDNPWGDVETAYRWLRKIAIDIRPDLIHFNNYGQAAYDWPEATIVVAHSCIMSWWRAVKQEDAPSEWRKYQNTTAGALKRATTVIAPTQSHLNEIENIYGSIKKKAVIYNARVFHPVKPAQKEPIIFAAGRIWDEAKNIKTLISIADKLDWPVYVAGNNRHPDTKAIVDPGNVRFLGSLSAEEVANWMERASIYAHPAHYEPFGLTVLEAAHYGAALALSDIPTFRELWDGAALFVNQRDSGQVRKALDRLIRDDALRNNLGIKARERSAGVSPKTMAGEYFSLYQHILTSDKRANINALTGQKT